MKAFLSRARFLAAAGTIAICAAARGSVPPVYLNHVVIYVSAETYDALKASPLIRNQFSDSREVTIHTEGGSINYTGLYLGGMNTYLEMVLCDPLRAGLSDRRPIDRTDSSTILSLVQ
jgi:hypothetical protein